MSLFKHFLHFFSRAEEEGKRIHKDFCQLLEHTPEGTNLLDVGCAEGTKALRYAEILSVPRENVYGIEIQEKYIKIASGKLNISIMDLEKGCFPFAGETFDVVTCNQIFEHLKNIFLPLSEMERVLRTGGHLAIGIPNLAALHNRILLLFGFQPVCNAILGPHIRCFTHKAFLNFLKSNPNFRLITITGSSLYPLPYPVVEFGAHLFPGLSAYTFYLLRKVKHNLQASSWRISSIGDTCL
ncbi:MAG: class I SAM-dependent methyltransferase [bacterium]|nr:class I SAM-dependent methyltransferase [bacterium]